jgi:hypothetical protein
MDDTKYIFEVLERAKVGMLAFAQLTGVSRESLYRWKRGNVVTDKLRLNLVRTYARHLDTAVTAGHLPLQGVSPKERTKVLREIISRVMKGGGR